MATRTTRTRAGPVLASLSSPSLPAPTTLAVVSDPNLAPDARGTWRVLHRAPGRFRAALADADRRGVDAVLSPGDLTRSGAPEEFALLDEVLADATAPFLAVPGDHDVHGSRRDLREVPPVERFTERYGGVSLPFVERVGGLDVVGLNSASTPGGSLSDTHEGVVGSAQLRWLDRTLPTLDTPVVCLHHSVTHPTTRAEAEGFAGEEQYRVRDADALHEVLVRHGVSLVLSGHVHWPGVAPVGAGHEVSAPATCSLPPSYLLLHVGPEGTTVELVPLTDRAGFEEAYVSAREGNDHGRAVAASAVSTGLVDDLLLAAEAGVPASAYRLDATDRLAGDADVDGGAP